jgi:hypothetical protein
MLWDPVAKEDESAIVGVGILVHILDNESLELERQVTLRAMKRLEVEDLTTCTVPKNLAHNMYSRGAKSVW